MQKQFILGIDIGGQTVKSGLYVVDDKNNLATKAVWIDHATTAKGVQAHANQIIDIFEKAAELAIPLQGRLTGAGIASPGRFGIDGIIKKGTNANVGLTVAEFDGVHLRGEYVKVMQQRNPDLLSVPFNVKNDGNAMLAGMIRSIQSKTREPLYDHRGNIVKPHCITGKTVGLIGLGTGLGHAIVHIDTDSHYHFVTDGHASKLRIEIDEQDWPILKKAGAALKAKSGKDELVICDDNRVRAEDLYRSPMVNAMAEVGSGEEITLSTPLHAQIIAMAGKYLGRTMAAIHSGENTDIVPENGWSEEEKEQAAKTSFYLFGGGLGRSPLGIELMKHADQELAKTGIDSLRLVQIPDTNVATYAAAIMAFDSLRLGITQAI